MLVSIVPKFCARRWSQIQKLSYQNPIHRAKLGIIEPWPECQSELFRMTPTAAAATREQHIHPGRCPESITHRDQISRSGIPHSDIYIYIYILIRTLRVLSSEGIKSSALRPRLHNLAFGVRLSAISRIHYCKNRYSSSDPIKNTR